MAGKQSGLGANFYVDGLNFSGDYAAFTRLATPQTVGEQTGIDKYAIERIALKKDGAIDGQVWFNPTGAHTFYKTLPTTDVLLSYWQGTALGAETLSHVAKLVDYSGTRAEDGMLTFNFTSVSNGYGGEWGVSLTPGQRTDTAATNGTGVDNGASTAFGLQARAHIDGVVGTSVTVKLQDSPDNAVWTDVVGGGFTAVLAGAHSGQRIATANNLTVARYLRAVTTGVFTQAKIAVTVTRNPIAGVQF